MLAQLNSSRIIAGDVDRCGIAGIAECLRNGLNGRCGWRTPGSTDALNETVRSLGSKRLNPSSALCAVDEPEKLECEIVRRLIERRAAGSRQAEHLAWTPTSWRGCGSVGSTVGRNDESRVDECGKGSPDRGGGECKAISKIRSGGRPEVKQGACDPRCCLSG